jgi:glycosyltransferase involved in cell wall biosynthesis
MSNALLEYMASGRAIVATRVGANERLIRDGLDGLLIAPESLPELTVALTRLLQELELARRLGESARQRAELHFSRDAMRRRFEDFYWKLRNNEPEA